MNVSYFKELCEKAISFKDNKENLECARSMVKEQLQNITSAFDSEYSQNYIPLQEEEMVGKIEQEDFDPTVHPEIEKLANELKIAMDVM